MVDLKFDKIRKIEGIKDGKLVWQYSCAAYINGKNAGVIVADTGQDCQNQVDHYLTHPESYVSQAMRSGKI